MSLAAAWLLLCAFPAPAAPALDAVPPATEPGLKVSRDGIPPAPSKSQGRIEALWARGTWVLEKGDPNVALHLFSAALALDDRRARSWNYLGGAHFMLGDLPRALQDFNRALELDPRDVRACNNLGTTLERLGEYSRAEQAYLRAESTDPVYPLTQRTLGILQSQRLGNLPAARRAWQRYLELAPNGAYAAEIRRELDALPAAPPLSAPDSVR